MACFGDCCPSTKIRRGPLTVSATTLLLCVVILRYFSLGYFAMGIVIKVHSGMLDNGMTLALNQIWVAGQPLGTLTNALVLTLVCMLPVYFLSGFIGILGGFCRNKMLLIVHVISVLFFLAFDVILLVFFGIIIVNHVIGHTRDDFTTIWNNYQSGNMGASMKSSFEDLTRVLQCCGVTGKSNTGCVSSSFTLGCYDRYGSLLDQYSRSYVAMIVVCMIFEIWSIVCADSIYRKIQNDEIKARKRKIWKESQNQTESRNEQRGGTLENGAPGGSMGLKASEEEKEKRFCQGMFWDCFIFFLSLCKKDPSEAFIGFIKILMIMCGSVLIVYGIALYASEVVNSPYLYDILDFLYFNGYNFRNILRGMAATCITFGFLTLVTCLFGFLNTCFTSKTKTAVFAGMLVFLMLGEVIVTCLWIPIHAKIHERMYWELLEQFRGFKGINVQIYKSWNFLFAIIGCCGLAYHEDWEGSSWTSTNLPESCCDYVDKRSDTLYYYRESSGCTPKSNNGCLQALKDIVDMASGIYYSFMILIFVFEVVLFIYYVRQFKALNGENIDKTEDRSQSPNRENENDSEMTDSRGNSGMWRVFFQNITSSWKRSKFIIFYWLGHIFHMLFGISFIIIGLACRTDSIFDHPNIKSLFKNLSFLWHDFSYILTCFNTTIIVTGVLAFCFSFISLFVPNFVIPKWISEVVGKFMNKVTSRVFLSLGMVFLFLFFIANVISMSLMIAVEVQAGWNMNDQLNTRLQLYNTYEISIGAYSDAVSSPWNYLFRVAECCGTRDYISFQQSTWYNNRINTDTQIPTTCCYTDYTERFIDRTNSNCTDYLQPGTYYSWGCTDAIMNRLKRYTIPYFVMLALMMLCQILLIIFTDRVFKYPPDKDIEDEDEIRIGKSGLFRTLWYYITNNRWINQNNMPGFTNIVAILCILNVVAIPIELVIGFGALSLRFLPWMNDVVLPNLRYLYTSVLQIGAITEGLMIGTFVCNLVFLVIHVVGIIAVIKRSKRLVVIHAVLLLVWILVDIVFIVFISYIFHLVYDCMGASDPGTELTRYSSLSTVLNVVCTESNISILRTHSWVLFAYIVYNLATIATILIFDVIRYRKISNLGSVEATDTLELNENQTEETN